MYVCMYVRTYVCVISLDPASQRTWFLSIYDHLVNAVQGSHRRYCELTTGQCAGCSYSRDVLLVRGFRIPDLPARSVEVMYVFFPPAACFSPCLNCFLPKTNTTDSKLPGQVLLLD
jgi:hypothetical protein